MLLRWPGFNAVLGIALVFALVPYVRAEEPGPATVPVASVEAHVGERANAHPAVGPAEDRAAKLQARADALRALLGGTLDPATDTRDLLVLTDDVFPIALEALAPPRADSSDDSVQPEAGQPDPLREAEGALREALRVFFRLTPQARADLLSAHQSKTNASLAGQRRVDAWSAEGTRLDAKAAAVERLVANAVEPGTDTQTLTRVELLALLPAELAAEAPADKALVAALASRNAASTRLRAALEAWMSLSAEERASRHDAAQMPPEIEPVLEEDEPAPDLDEAFVDEDEAQDREDISDKVEEAADAAREKEEALDVARMARSEALRVVAQERARLLGIKEQQALFAADLPRWRQLARELHESSLEWHRRVDEVVDDISGSEADADAVYGELRSTLDDVRGALAEALARAANPGREVPAPPEDFNDADLPADVDRADLVELRDSLQDEVELLSAEELVVAWEVAALLRDDVVMLNRDRLRLLPSMSANVRDDLTGLGVAGRAQARRELGQIGLELRYHAMSLPHDAVSIVSSIQSRPLELVVRALELVCMIALFRWWRAQADTLLRKWRGPMWARSPAQRFRANSIWYLLRIRQPVEWLLLLIVLPLALGTAADALELRLTWLVLVWVQGARAVVLTVDAIAERQSIYGVSTKGNAKLRFRSLRLIGLTVTLVGLILTLTSGIVGRGTIYRWVLQGCWVLVAPIGVWLVSRWRPTIVARLEGAVKTKVVARWVIANQSGVRGFLAAAVGGGWLLGQGTSAWLVRQLSGLDTTRKVLAYLFRREVARKAETSTLGPRGAPLAGRPFDQLGPHSQATKMAPIEEPARNLVTSALELTEAEACTLSVVVGERGMGKSTFLRRIVQRSEETTCIVGCPPEGFTALLEALAVQFDAADYGLETVAKAIRDAGPSLICIDDAHRMIAPAVGGLEELDLFTRFALQVGGDVSWMVAVQEAAWHFVERARGERVFFDQVLSLPRWTEDQIATLIQRRTGELELKPNFDALVVATESDDPAEGRRTALGYYRILWDHSEGNPAVALQAWRCSLFVSDNEAEPVVRLFEEPSSTEIERLPATLLFVLRAIVQLELATPQGVADCTQLPAPDVADAIRFSVARGYVEPSSGRFRLSWTWYRTITRVLVRQHLLVS
ncbi:MAG: AAA family ATPase [Nannocystaceae bacterium]|nr:AAA family ATPase [Nannocystaceae bacterium]